MKSTGLRRETHAQTQHYEHMFHKEVRKLNCIFVFIIACLFAQERERERCERRPSTLVAERGSPRFVIFVWGWLVGWVGVRVEVVVVLVVVV